MVKHLHSELLRRSNVKVVRGTSTGYYYSRTKRRKQGGWNGGNESKGWKRAPKTISLNRFRGRSAIGTLPPRPLHCPTPYVPSAVTLHDFVSLEMLLLGQSKKEVRSG